MIASDQLLWESAQEIKPCFRMEFRLLLSQNRLAGETWQKTNEIELWNQRGEARLVQTAKTLGIPTEGYAEYKNYIYRGKPKKKIMSGERLKTFLFTETIIMICRIWSSGPENWDIDNTHLKAVIDGFVRGRLVPNDTVKYIRGVFRWYEGINPAAGMSNDEKDERRRIRNERKLQGIKRSLPPPPNRKIYIDCYRLSRLVEEKIDFFALVGR